MVFLKGKEAGAILDYPNPFTANRWCCCHTIVRLLSCLKTKGEFGKFMQSGFKLVVKGRQEKIREAVWIWLYVDDVDTSGFVAEEVTVLVYLNFFVKIR